MRWRRRGSTGLPPASALLFGPWEAQDIPDERRFSSAGYASTIGHVMGRTILQMDPPEHQRHRALVTRAFRARVLDTRGAGKMPTRARCSGWRSAT